MSFFDSVSKKISDVSQTAVQKGKDIADIAKLNSQINDEEKKINNFYVEIGKQYVLLHGEAPEEAMVEYVNGIKEAENNIKTFKENLQVLKNVAVCPNCGAEIASGAAFCNACGNKMPVLEVTPVEAPVVTSCCSKCGAEIAAGNRFCTSCGNPVDSNNAQ